jgi:hypothetical protein
VAVMRGLLLSGAVGDDVDWKLSDAVKRRWEAKGRGERRRRTQHVALLVLTALGVRDVALDAEVHEGQVLD